ncbi:hypothetical protein GH714_019221 [Hevea brasiliensis]|uniref:Pentacotripeptide-repeat region of PRORP domain-containing protein n=1 Tax=Hevea brasiliensis TaxID=3981 RepID=A0A6A6K5Q0_HEVBR|nr:hypothetical protein GH714_019221 [Hevea brasiliensis]
MGKKGQTRMAMWLFSEMRNSGCRPDTSVYNALITAHLHSKDKAKALSKALSYFEKMKGMERCQPNVVTYNILLRAFAQAQNVNQVNALFKDLDQSIVSPDIYTFNGMMDAYGKNGMIREMESVLSRMKSNQCKPDIITFNLLIDSYGKKQDLIRWSRDIFDDMVESGKEIKVSTLNAMLDVYCMNGLPMEADLLFDSARSFRVLPDSSTYKLLYKAYTKANMKELVQKLLKHMDRDGIVPNKRFFLEALGAFKSIPATSNSATLATGSGSQQSCAKT